MREGKGWERRLGRRKEVGRGELSKQRQIWIESQAHQLSGWEVEMRAIMKVASS